MARNMITGQNVKIQDLTGNHFTGKQRQLAQEQADQLAAKMTAKTKQPWTGFLKEYFPTQRS